MSESIKEEVRQHMQTSVPQIKLKPRVLPLTTNSRYVRCISDHRNIRQGDTRPWINGTVGKDAQQGLQILYTNADVLTASKMIELRERVKMEKPHIIAVCEVLPKNPEIKEDQDETRKDQDYTIQGFSLHRWTRGRGINIWTHSCLDKSISIPTAKALNSCNIEAAHVEVKLQRGDSLIFSCFYRSPNLSAEGDLEINKVLISAASYASHVNICGDFNYRDIDWSRQTCKASEESPESHFLSAVRDSFLFQHTREETRNRGNDQPTLLDLVFTNEEGMTDFVEQQAPLGKSDHQVLTWKFKCYTEKSDPKAIFQWKKADFNSMRLDLAQKNWSFDGNTNDIERSWNEFKKTVTDLRDKYVPQRRIGVMPSWDDKGDFPASSHLRDLIKKKTIAHRKWKRRVKWGDATAERLAYSRLRNKTVSVSRREKRSFERGIALRSGKDDIKPFWSLCRRRLKTKKGVAPLLKDTSDPTSTTYDDVEKAEALQAQFISVCTREPDGDIPRLPEFTQERLNSLTITADAVLKKLKLLQTSKSCGPDELHPLLLKELADHIATPLADIFSASQRLGAVPSDWKTALVSPIFKKGAANKPVNYRPVSLTCIVCKVMESLVREAIVNFLTTNNLLSDKQFGFIGGRSTTLQLLNFLEFCTDVMSDRGVTDTVYLDFAKAFDSVPHRRLLGKLQSYGITGNLHRWIEAFLVGRIQRVCVNGKLSSEETVLSGIPQGSVLGPLLFVVYINDLPTQLNCSSLMFADDTKIFSRIQSHDDAYKLQDNLRKLEQWSHDWLLVFHPDKCKILTVGRHEDIVYAHNYTLFGQLLEHIDEEKDLGVIIDSELTFESHITAKVKKGNQMMGLIRRVFSFLGKEMFLRLYTSFVRSHLEFSQVVWAPWKIKLIRLIESVQERATKLVDGMANLSYEDRLHALGLTTLSYRRLRGSMIEVWKHFNIYTPGTIPSVFKRVNRPIRATRHPLQLYPAVAKDGITGVQQNSFYYKITETWNSLSTDVVQADSLNSFKNKLDESWKNHPEKYKIVYDDN